MGQVHNYILITNILLFIKCINNQNSIMFTFLQLHHTMFATCMCNLNNNSLINYSEHCN